MKKIFYKKIAVIVVGLFASMTVSFAQNEIVKHIVDRGETLEDIAKKYGVTTDQIVKDNPDAAQFVYVGMELKIFPKSASVNKSSEKPQQKYSARSTDSFSNNYNPTSPEKAQTNLRFGISGGYSMTNYVGKDEDNDILSGFHLGVKGIYQITENFFTDFGLYLSRKGYQKDLSSSSGDEWDGDGGNYDMTGKEKLKTINLDIPVYIGYSFHNFFVKFGPYLTYAVSGEKTNKSANTIYPDIHSSETEYTSTSTKISKIDAFNRFGCGLGVGLGYTMENFVISGVYQRGLSKQFDKKKSFEQNFHISLGYIF